MVIGGKQSMNYISSK